MHYDNVTNDDINSYLDNLINELIEKSNTKTFIICYPF